MFSLSMAHDNGQERATVLIANWTTQVWTYPAEDLARVR